MYILLDDPKIAISLVLKWLQRILISNDHVFLTFFGFSGQFLTNFNGTWQKTDQKLKNKFRRDFTLIT